MELPVEIITTIGLSVASATVSVYVTLKVAGAKLERDIAHLTEMVKMLMEDVKKVEITQAEHQNSDHHVSAHQIKNLERQIIDVALTGKEAIANSNSNYLQLSQKFDKFTEKMDDFQRSCFNLMKAK